MRELRPGDLVFDLYGHPTPVLAVSETMVGRPCRAVDFSDGTTIVADLDHQWPVWAPEIQRPRILTTREVERRLKAGRDVYVGAVGARKGALHRRERVLAGSTAERSRAHPWGENSRYGREISQALGPRRRGVPRASARRAIKGVRECESVPVCCIEVGSPDGVFLVSRSFIPTHNSSLGRLGLIVHATAGFCDPGWKGTLTLELNNLTRVPIKLYPGLLIAQLSFMTLDRPARRPYGSPELGSHYQGQRAATESRYEGTRRRDGGRIGEPADGANIG